MIEELKHKVIWLTGLSGSGKSTFSTALSKKLTSLGVSPINLDGDLLRKGINSDLTFSLKDRQENLRRAAHISKVIRESGVPVICSFITPKEENRNLITEIIGKSNVIIVYINSSLNTCETRDVKGLYAKARSGELKDFTGISAPFEEPINCDYEIDTESNSVEESVDSFMSYLQNK